MRRRRIDPRWQAAQDARDLRAGQRIGALLRRRGSVCGELGLELAARAELLSAPFRSGLAQAVAAWAPLPFAGVQQILEAQLGAVHRHFSWIDPQPLETGPSAQVHRARLHGGPLVEVRVRPPGLEPARARRDLRRLRRSMWLWKYWFVPLARRELLDDLERSVEEIIDQRRIGQRAEQLAAELTHDAMVVVPTICWPATAPGVLTFEWVPRFPLAAAAGRGLKVADCLATLLRLYAPRLLGGSFHTRPPAGALWLVNESVPDEALPDGQPRLLVLDLSMTRALPEARRSELPALLRALADERPLANADDCDVPSELRGWVRSLCYVARLCKSLDPAVDLLPALLAHAREQAPAAASA